MTTPPSPSNRDNLGVHAQSSQHVWEAGETWARSQLSATRRLRVLAIALVFAGVGIYPFITIVVTFIWSRPMTGHVVLLALGAGLIVSPIVRSTDFSAIREWTLSSGLGKVIAVTCMLLLVLASIMAVTAWWLLGAPRITSPEVISTTGAEKIAIRVFAIIAGLGGAVYLVLAYRRQHTTEIAESRVDQQAFTESFRSAAELLGGDHYAEREAGVYAMASLVDTAPDSARAQVAVNVLCGQLRRPFHSEPFPLPDNEDESDDDQQNRLNSHEEETNFREAIIRVIASRLRNNERWQRMDFDFTKVTFDHLDLQGVTFSGGKVSFRRARFLNGKHSFVGATFASEIDFGQATFEPGSIVYFSEANFSRIKINFSDSHLNACALIFHRAKFVRARIHFTSFAAEHAHLEFNDAQFDSSKLEASQCQILETTIRFVGSQISDGTFDLSNSQFFDGSFDFRRATLRNGLLNFHRSSFTRTKFDFSSCTITGGSIQFTLVKAKGVELRFWKTIFREGFVGISADFNDSSINFEASEIHNATISFAQGHLGNTHTSFDGIGEVHGGKVDFTQSTGQRPDGLDGIRSITAKYGDWDKPNGPPKH